MSSKDPLDNVSDATKLIIDKIAAAWVLLES